MNGDVRTKARFSVGVAADLASLFDGRSDMGLDRFDQAGIKWAYVPLEDGFLSAGSMSSHEAFIIGPAKIRAEALDEAESVPLLLARYGLGTDKIDLEACTRRDVIVTTTPDGNARPVAVAALTHILASTLNLHAKDAMVRAGDWDKATKLRWQGRGLVGRTVGLIGLGSVGSTIVKLLGPLEPHIIACVQRPRTAEEAAHLGVELVPLDQLLERSDVVVVACPLTPKTFHLLGATELARMKPTASLVNIARGPIVDHEALVDALEQGVIASAGLDVFEQEPLPADDRLTRLPNVMLSPHDLHTTDQSISEAAQSAVRAILSVRAGKVPAYVINPQVLDRPSLMARLQALRQRQLLGP